MPIVIEKGLIHCEYCNARHRELNQLEKCKTRKEAREKRELLRAADKQKRINKALSEAPEKYTHRRWRDGTAWVNIAAGLKREYLPPKGTEDWNSIHQKEWDVKLAIILMTYYYPPKGWQ